MTGSQAQSKELLSGLAAHAKMAVTVVCFGAFI